MPAGLIKPTQTRASDQSSKKEDIYTQRKKEAGESTSLQNLNEELKNILLTEKTDLEGMKKALIFWAHDDTVEAEKTYRYRLRLGVFNPIAGIEQVAGQDEPQKNKAILWSDFSEPSESVEIPPKLCFFAREIQEATKTVTVTVSRYVLGYWYSADFKVKTGETIGNVAKVEPSKAQSPKAESPKAAEQLTIPQQVDYATGAVLVDVVQADSWTSGTNPYKRQYHDMLYSFDGASIGHMAVEQKYWPEKLQTMYASIKKSERELKHPLRPFGAQISEPRRGTAPAKEGSGPMSTLGGG
jgi:hypothetical protein